MEKKVILSGIQATGDLHLGHYIGVLKRFVEMQEEFNCYYMVANLKEPQHHHIRKNQTMCLL